ncbi:hypothetical protein K438DRAFT_1941957 [Mycena galopus ATCC 62051]|nr:hypothetical protein K438DRAFT_1941957 [Mycena galopus ATCC 62051]
MGELHEWPGKPPLNVVLHDRHHCGLGTRCPIHKNKAWRHLKAGETGSTGVEEEEETRNLRAQVPTQKLGGVRQWCKGLLGNGVEKPEEIHGETGFGGSWWTSGQCRDFENGGMDGAGAGVTVGLAALGAGSTLSVGLARTIGPIAIDTRASWA